MSEVLMSITLFVLVVMILVLAVLAARAVVVRQVPVEVTINDSQSFATLSGQSLLNALKDHNILIPSACAGAGTCGLCQVAVPDGGGAPLPTERAKLDRQALHDHMRLACQLILRSDTHVTLPEELLGAETWACRVRSTQMLAPFIREIVLDLPPEASSEIHAGAFFQVSAPPYDIRFADLEISDDYEDVWVQTGARSLSSRSHQETERAYSVANRPEDAGRIVLNVRLALPPPVARGAPPGVVSSYLFSLKPGDELDVAGPYGSFRATDSGREMVVIGGGVGMAPLRAIIHDQLKRAAGDRKISFWYGARSGIELYYADEFDALAQEFETFQWTVALSDPKPEDQWQGPTGFIHDVAFERYLKDHPAPEDCEFYLCGPPLMIQAVMAMLDDIGADPDRIFNDDFGS